MGKGVPTDDPERIWLQPFNNGDRTWNEYPCGDNNAEYVRVDLADQRTCQHCSWGNLAGADGSHRCDVLLDRMPGGFGCNRFEAEQ